MLKVAVGHSCDPDSRLAIAEVLQQCIATLMGKPPQAGILIAAVDFDHALLLAEIYQVFPDIELIGSSSDGEVSSVLEFQQDSLTLMLFASDQVKITAGLGRGLSKDVVAATQRAVQEAIGKTSQPAQFCLALPESLTTSAESIVNGLKRALGTEIPVLGGLAADHWQFKTSYQFFGQEVLRDAVPILLFSGAVRFSHGIASGWQPLSQPSRITKAEGNVVYCVNERSAMAFYDDYLGQAPATEYPLAVMGNDSSFYLRAPNAHDEDSGSVTFFGDVPQGATVQIAVASRAEIVAAAEQAMQEAIATYPGKTPTVMLFFSCAARRQILGRRTMEEYQRVQQQLAQPVSGCGIYVFGEIAPLKMGGETQFHNETFVVLLMGVE